MSLSNANNLRKSIDKTLGDRGFLTSQVPFNKDVLRRFTNILRQFTYPIPYFSITSNW